MRQLAIDLERVFWSRFDIDHLTPQERSEHNAATHSYIFEHPFTSYDRKIRDQFHLSSGLNNLGSKTANYRRPVHERCNKNYQDSHVVPIVCHNVSGYESHFILEQIT